MKTRLFRPAVRMAAAAILVMAVGAPLAVTPQASAQMSFSIGGPGGPGGRISKKSLDRYEKLLGLDDAQKEAAAALHDAYSQESKTAQEAMREDMKAIEAGAKDGDMSVFQDKMPAIMKKHGEKTAAIEKSFLDDLKALLTPQQADQWPRLERLRRREQYLRFGMVSGSSVDLVSLVDGLKFTPDQTQPLGGTLDEYEMAMDRLLVDREHDEAEQQKQQGDKPAFDMEAMQDGMKKMQEGGLKVRDLNQRYARLVSSLLPEDARAKFDEAFQQKAFRQVYKESQASRSLTAAEKFDDLTESQRDRLRQISENYKRQLPGMNQKWSQALQQAETDGKAGGMGMMFFGGDQSQQSQELADARKARREFDDKTAADLKEVLNDDQEARLPKQRQGFAFGGPDGGDFELDMGDMEDHIAVMVGEEATAQGEGGAVIMRSVHVATDGSGGGGDKPAQTSPKPAKPPTPAPPPP